MSTDTSRPNACSLEVASPSFARRFRGRPLTSVMCQATRACPSKLLTLAVIPWAAAGLPGTISLTSAVFPFRTRPRGWPSTSLFKWYTCAKGSLLTIISMCKTSWGLPDTENIARITNTELCKCAKLGKNYLLITSIWYTIRSLRFDQLVEIWSIPYRLPSNW